MTTYAHISVTPGDSAFIQTRLDLDPYAPRECTIMVEKDYVVKMSKRMTALEARETGLTIDPAIPDEKMIFAEWEEERVEQIPTKQVRLRYRKKSPRLPVKQSRFRGIHPELASAAANPYKLIQYPSLIDSIKDEINHWMNNPIESEECLHPILLVLLSCKEQPDGRYSVGVREIFKILNYSPWHITAMDSEKHTYEIDLDSDVVDSGLIRRFTLFLPASTHLEIVKTT